MSQSGEHVASTATQQQDASIDALITQLETATCTVPRRSAIKGHGVSAEAALAARRRRHLEAQQQRKRDLTAQIRRLASFADALSDSESDDATDQESEAENAPTIQPASKPDVSQCGSQQSIWSHDSSRAEPAASSQRRSRSSTTRRRRRRPLMEGEPMLMLPEDAAENWYATLCPVGKRCWVVSSSGITVSRLRNGALLAKFESCLPAGHRTYRGNRSADHCILDCIYVEHNFTYYILDMMCWKGHPFFDCDTEFRRYWLQTQMTELDPPRPSTRLLYSFQALPSNLATPEYLRQLILEARVAATAAANAFATTIHADARMDNPDAMETVPTATTSAEPHPMTPSHGGTNPTVLHTSSVGTQSSTTTSPGVLFSPAPPDMIMLVHRQTCYVLGRTPLAGYLALDRASTILDQMMHVSSHS